MGKHRFWKLIQYDLICGMWSNRAKWMVCLGIFVFLSDMAIKTCDIDGVDAGYLGYLTYLMQGLPPYVRTQNSIFQLPVPWLLFHAYFLFLVCFYPTHDLSGCGQKVIVMAKKRESWWGSKVWWSISTAIGYYVLFYFILFVMVLLEGETDRGIEGIWQRFGLDLFQITKTEIFLIWVGLPILFSVTMSLIQMLLGVVWKPVVAYIFSISILIVSVYYLHPLLPGNYAMIMRSRPFVAEGTSPYEGIILFVFVSVASVIAGRRVVKKMDILS